MSSEIHHRPGAVAVSFPLPPPSLLSFDDDVDFGDFTFAPVSTSSQSQQQPQQQQRRHQQQGQQDDDGDDDWGDFVTSPAGSNHFGTHGGMPPSPYYPPGGHESVSRSTDSSAAHSAAEGSKWQKPKGAIPLAVFGEEEPGEQETPMPLPQPLESPLPVPGNSAAVSSPSSGNRLDSAGNLTDLIKNLYSQAEPVAGGTVADGRIDGGTFEGGDDDFDENGWEFKDAFSTNGVSKEQELRTENFGLEDKRESNGHAEVESVDNGSSKPLGIGNLLGVNNDDWPPSHAYGNGIMENEPVGDPFEAHFATDNSFFDIHPENTHARNGDVQRSNLENDKKEDDDDSWDFQSAFSENKFVNVSQQEGISEATSEMVRDTVPHDYEVADKTELLAALVKLLGDRESLEKHRKAAERAFSAVSGGIVQRVWNLVASFVLKETASGSILVNTVENWPLHSFSNLNEEIVGDSYTDQKETRGFKYSSNNPQINILDLYNKIEQPNGVHFAQAHNENGQTIDEVGDSGPNVTPLKCHKDLEIVVNQDCEFEVDQHHPTELSHDAFLRLFCLLKDGSLFLISQHLVTHEKSHGVTCHSVEEAEGTEIYEDFRAAHQKLLEVNISESDIKDKFPSKDVCINQLLKEVKESNGGAFEKEYGLSAKILLAEKNLGSAIKLFEHASSIVDILTFASEEQKHAYVVAWSKIVEACAQELKIGATIWEELLHANDSTQIFSLGQYFLALGEIYRVVEILVTSINYYKPWIISNWGYSIKLMASLGICSAAWDTHLVKALETIGDASDEQLAGAAKVLLSSVNVVHGLDLSSLQSDGGITCKISLLPAAALPEMKVISWNGEYYFLKLANLWANRVSHNPPQLSLVQE